MGMGYAWGISGLSGPDAWGAKLGTWTQLMCPEEGTRQTRVQVPVPSHPLGGGIHQVTGSQGLCFHNHRMGK